MKKPHICNKLPYSIKIDSDILRLSSEASQKYGEYINVIKTDLINKNFLLKSLMKIDSFKSTQIEGTMISQNDLFSLNRNNSQEENEITNYIETLSYGANLIKEKDLELEDILKFHEMLLVNTRGDSKKPGELRKKQNWIGPVGSTIEYATFIPPVPEEVEPLLENLLYFYNNNSELPLLIQVAINHAQFEIIHPFNDGNGRLGRLLIALNMAKVSNEEVVLFVSEVIELYKPAYARALKDASSNNLESFVKFFLQMVIDQCSSYLFKTEIIQKIIEDDLNIIVESSNSVNTLDIFEMFMKEVVLKTNDVSEQLGISIQTVRAQFKRLIKLGIISKRTSSTEYMYTKLYNIYLGK